MLIGVNETSQLHVARSRIAVQGEGKGGGRGGGCGERELVAVCRGRGEGYWVRVCEVSGDETESTPWMMNFSVGGVAQSLQAQSKLSTGALMQVMLLI